MGGGQEILADFLIRDAQHECVLEVRQHGCFPWAVLQHPQDVVQGEPLVAEAQKARWEGGREEEPVWDQSGVVRVGTV